MKFSTVFGPRKRVFESYDPDSFRTKQSDLPGTDVNAILDKYARGIMPEPRPGLYGDYSNVPDYMSALLQVQRAQEQFDALPAMVRDRFKNDPAEFLAFATDARNAAEMIELGLAVERPAADPVVTPPQPAASKSKGSTRSANTAAGTPAKGDSGDE